MPSRRALLILALPAYFCSPSKADTPAPPARRTPAAARAPVKPAPAYHPVFSLVDNRLLAHLLREGGLFVPLGHPGAAKYVNFGRPWSTFKLSAKQDGRPVALAIRNVTWLRVPLTEAQAGATVLSLSLKSPGAGGLIVKINKTSLKPAKLSSGWQTVELTVPPQTLWSGENRLQLTFGASGKLGGVRSWGALEWLHLGTRALGSPGPLGPARDRRLQLPAGGGLAYYVHPYPGTRLHLTYPAEGCDVLLRLSAQGVKPVEQVRHDPGTGAGKQTEATFELGAIADRVGRLELTALGERCKALELTDAALEMPGPAPALKRGKPPKNIVFWMMDNARGDRYTLYNPSTRVQTPVITELGKTGTLFSRVYVQGNESRVSHASIWTGAYPRQARFIDPKAKLDLAWVTLPEAMQRAGLYTAGWLANGFVSRLWGFGEGWNIFKNYIHDRSDVMKPSPLSAEGLAGYAMRFLANPPKDRFYVYLGTIDSHVSWRGRQPWLKLYDPAAYDGPFKKDVAGKLWEKVATGNRGTTPEEKRRILAIYDSTVSYNDRALGVLLAALKEKGILDETLVVVTADHGEELWDHGRVGHGSSIRQELVAVPLVLRYPPLFGKGVVVRQGVDTLSIMPTLLDAIGAPIPDTVQGESLLPLAQGIGAGYPRPSIASQYELAHAIRLERWKLRIGGRAEPELWDLESKEGEHKELAVSRPLEVRWLTDALSTWLTYQDRWRSTRWGVASNHTAALAEDLETGTGPGPIRVGRSSGKSVQE
jgi:arylsulfatase A-like enzyme